jgi:Zn-dependent protease
MLEILFSNPLAFALIFPSLIIAITIHEFAHAWTADRLGDPTPRAQGRVTLNPLAHLDPLGTLAILLTSFGWGRPVEFDPYNLRHRTRDTALIAVAGPVSNILLALACAIALRVFNEPVLLSVALIQLVYLNLTLAFFNLVPVRPLDGEKIIYAFLPKDIGHEYKQFMNQWGLLVLILMIFPIFGPSPVSRLISPIISFFGGLLV